MQGRTGSALPSAIAFAVAVSTIPLLTFGSAARAETCLAAPNGPAPQGSHWFYRLERPSLRKCWRLVQKEKAVQTAARTAPQAASPAEPDDEGDTAPAAAPLAPVSNVTPLVPAEPVIRTLVTRNASNTDIAQPPAVTDTSAQASPVTVDAAPAPLAPAPREQQTPAATEQPVVMPAVTTDTVMVASNGVPVFQWALGAVALLGLIACAVLLLLGMARRRNDVLTMLREAETMPYAHSPETTPADEPPTFAPLPALGPFAERDDVDAALHRMLRRRRAA